MDNPPNISQISSWGAVGADYELIVVPVAISHICDYSVIRLVDILNPTNRNVVFDVRGFRARQGRLLLTSDMIEADAYWPGLDPPNSGLKYYLRHVTLPDSVGAGFKEHGPNVKFSCVAPRVFSSVW